MSLTRFSLIFIQAVCNQLACTHPHQTPVDYRYFKNQAYIFQVGPIIFMHQRFVVWLCALFELLAYFKSQNISLSPFFDETPNVCLRPQADIHMTFISAIGAAFVAAGAYIRLDCYRTLGKLFTYDLTIFPEHKLVTWGPYSLVRHPSYTGTLLVVFGIAFSHLTRGSWLTECGPFIVPGSGIIVMLVWCTWLISALVSRAKAEDKQMRERFSEQWDAYAAKVHWWFFPGLI